MGWIKKALVNLVLIGLSAMLALALAEVALHFTRVQYKFINALEPKGYIAFDPQLGFDIVPGFATSTHAFFDYSYPVWSNSLGCFDYPFDGSSPYVFFTGDSFTWGFTPLDQKWTKVVQQETGTRSLACGVNAYGTRQEVIKTANTLSKLPQPPKVIVVGYFGSNDVDDDAIYPNDTAFGGYRIPAQTHCTPAMQLENPALATSSCILGQPDPSFLQRVKLWLGTHSVLYGIAIKEFNLQNVLRGLVVKMAPQWGERSGIVHTPLSYASSDSQDESDSAWRAHISNIAAFKKLADQYHAKLLFVLIPDKSMAASTTTGSSWNNERVKSYLDSLGIGYIDLLPAFQASRQEALYWSYDGHWNPEGNRLAGLLVSEYLIQHGYVETADPISALSSVHQAIVDFGVQ